MQDISHFTEAVAFLNSILYFENGMNFQQSAISFIEDNFFVINSCISCKFMNKRKWQSISAVFLQTQTNLNFPQFS